MFLPVIGTESRVGECKQEETKNPPVVVSATRTSKRLREKKDQKLLNSVTADSVAKKRERASPGPKQRRPCRPKSMCCCYVCVTH